MDGFIKLRIAGVGLNIQEITNKLGRVPDFSYKKGDVYVDKIIKGRTVIYGDDCWLAEAKKSENETLEECIEKFVLEFRDVANYLKTLASKFCVTVWISVYPEQEQFNIRLSKKTVFALNEMGVSVDFDVAFLQNFYDGTYLDEQDKGTDKTRGEDK